MDDVEIVSTLGADPRIMFMARLLATVYGEERAARALSAHFNLSSDTTLGIMRQLHANDN